MSSYGVGGDVLYGETTNFVSEHIPVSLNRTVIKICQENVKKFGQIVIYRIEVGFFVVANRFAPSSAFWGVAFKSKVINEWSLIPGKQAMVET